MQLMLTENNAFLGKKGERFTVRVNGAAPREVPARAVKHIMVAGPSMSISSDAVRLACENGVALSFLSYTGEPYGHIVPADAHRQVRLRQEQLDASRDARGIRIGRVILQTKLGNQAATLRYFAKSRKQTEPKEYATLRAAAGAVQGFATQLEEVPDEPVEEARKALMNREARAALEYWAAVKAFLPPGLGFKRRVRKGATDPVNVALNYGYGILYTRVTSAVLTAGLDPYAGFLHSIDDGKAGFVFDVVEEFRQVIVDRPVFAALTKRWTPTFEVSGRLDAESRKALAARVLGRFNDRLDYRGKSVAFGDFIQARVYEIAATLRGGREHVPHKAAW